MTDQIQAAMEPNSTHYEKTLFRWCCRLMLVLANEELKRATDYENHDWYDIMATSQSRFQRKARELAGIDHQSWDRIMIDERFYQFGTDELWEEFAKGRGSFESVEGLFP